MTDAEYRIDPEEAVAAAIDAAEEIDDSVADEVPEKPRLLVDKSNPHQTVATLRDILAEAGGLYDRGVPVRLAVDQTQKGTVAQMMTRSGVVLRAHQVCRPYALKKGDEVDVGLPSWFALMYLEWWGEWQLPAAERYCLRALASGRRNNQQHRRLRPSFGHVVRECAGSHRTRSRAADEG